MNTSIFANHQSTFNIHVTYSLYPQILRNTIQSGPLIFNIPLCPAAPSFLFLSSSSIQTEIVPYCAPGRPGNSPLPSYFASKPKRGAVKKKEDTSKPKAVAPKAKRPNPTKMEYHPNSKAKVFKRFQPNVLYPKQLVHPSYSLAGGPGTGMTMVGKPAFLNKSEEATPDPKAEASTPKPKAEASTSKSVPNPTKKEGPPYRNPRAYKRFQPSPAPPKPFVDRKYTFAGAPRTAMSTLEEPAKLVPRALYPEAAYAHRRPARRIGLRQEAHNNPKFGKVKMNTVYEDQTLQTGLGKGQRVGNPTEGPRSVTPEQETAVQIADGHCETCGMRYARFRRPSTITAGIAAGTAKKKRKQECAVCRGHRVYNGKGCTAKRCKKHPYEACGRRGRISCGCIIL
jgi:hypothetical protein